LLSDLGVRYWRLRADVNMRKNLRVTGALVVAATALVLGAGPAAASGGTDAKPKVPADCIGDYLRDSNGYNTGSWALCNGGTFRTDAQCSGPGGTYTAYGNWARGGAYPPQFSFAYCDAGSYAINRHTVLQ
jgi:hypothetical protein